MSGPVIHVENLSKRYRLGQFNATTLRDEVEALFRGRRRERAEEADFWALRDVSFEVQQGEVLGIIGRNGAGKSTLLKILSRITEPTSGEVRIKGRVASLLEVGTGFHPELSGRENIFLNGAILGMTRAEIARKFDEIVDFAEVERFLDTPVKRYSSGMYVRLAFAVAAHLEPEILIVDEVLAVGDAEFQKKCLGKMQEVSGKGGRTVLFVSHNMAAVENLCHRCILLSHGQILRNGEPAEALAAYRAASQKGGAEAGEVVTHLRLLDERGAQIASVAVGRPVTFEVTLESERRLRKPRLSVNILGDYGNRLCCFTSDVQTAGLAAFSGKRLFAIATDSFRMAPGHYAVEVVLWDDDTEVEVVLWPGGVFVEAADVYGTGSVPDRSFGGSFAHPAKWKVS